MLLMSNFVVAVLARSAALVVLFFAFIKQKFFRLKLLFNDNNCTHVLIPRLRTTNKAMACWITDGSIGFTINGNVITHVDNIEIGNVFNAMWQDGDGVSSGEHYWKIYFPILEEEAAVGLTSKDNFREGYTCKGLKYSGNLSDGCGLIVGGFGPRPKQGDTVGILAVFDGGRLKIYFDVNGKILGLAFDVPASTFKSIYPMVSFHKSGSATCTKQTEIVDTPTLAPTTFTGIEGNWKLTYFEENDVGLDLIRTATLKITKFDADKYSLCVGVVNRKWFVLTKENGNWKTSGVCVTRKGGYPESMTYEERIQILITKIKTVEVGQNGNLSVKSDAMSTTWIRCDATPGPFVGRPFSRFYN